MRRSMDGKNTLLSAAIPVDVVGRSTVQVGDDFILMGASDDGESASTLKWDTRKSEWVELQVRILFWKRYQSENFMSLTMKLFLRLNPTRRSGHPWSSAASV